MPKRDILSLGVMGLGGGACGDFRCCCCRRHHLCKDCRLRIQGCRTQGVRTHKAPAHGSPSEIKKVDFWKILGLALPGVEYISMSLGSVFKLFRGPQLPYMAKSKKSEN